MTQAYLISAARTPIGSFLGGLQTIPAPELGSIAIRAAVERSRIGFEQFDEVIMGNVVSAGLGQAPARQAALAAGFPPSIPAVTVNKVCGSGLKAVMFAASAIKAGDARAIVAGGMENMSRSPHIAEGLRTGKKLGDIRLVDVMVLDGLTCAFEGCHMGSHAEYIAERFGITRSAQDAYAMASQQRAAKAVADGVYDEEIVPVTVGHRRQESVIRTDECLKPDSSLEALASLATVFQSDGTVTAGNASTLSDGAAAVVVADEALARASESSLTARIVAYHTIGTPPKDLFIAPVAAVQGVLAKAGLSIEEVDLFEINEAFAAQVLACNHELKIPEDRLNVFGGGISIGHPIGASGARVLTTLLYALRRNALRRGLVSLCLGGGNAVAMIVERI